MSKKAREVAARYGRKSDIIEIVEDIIQEQYRVSAYTKPLCPIITSNEEVQAAEWGLIPFWVKPKPGELPEDSVKRAEDIRKGTVNARSETLFNLPSFRGLVTTKRCLIPSTGFFEHHHNPDKTTSPYYIYLKELDIFSMGGLFNKWHNPVTGQVLETFTQITTAANPLLAKIHNGGKNPFRMPLIIPPEQEEKWLNPELSDEGIKAFFNPYPADRMDAYPIYNNFLKKDPDDKTILDRNNKVIPVTL